MSSFFKKKFESCVIRLIYTFEYNFNLKKCPKLWLSRHCKNEASEISESIILPGNPNLKGWVYEGLLFIRLSLILKIMIMNIIFKNMLVR